MEVSYLHTLNRFTSGERALSVHWIGGWVGLTADVDNVEKRKKYLAASGSRISIPCSPTHNTD
jgi:hypothetical protein